MIWANQMRRLVECCQNSFKLNMKSDLVFELKEILTSSSQKKSFAHEDLQAKLKIYYIHTRHSLSREWKFKHGIPHHNCCCPCCSLNSQSHVFAFEAWELHQPSLSGIAEKTHDSQHTQTIFCCWRLNACVGIDVCESIVNSLLSCNNEGSHIKCWALKTFSA